MSFRSLQQTRRSKPTKAMALRKVAQSKRQRSGQWRARQWPVLILIPDIAISPCFSFLRQSRFETLLLSGGQDVGAWEKFLFTVLGQGQYCTVPSTRITWIATKAQSTHSTLENDAPKASNLVSCLYIEYALFPMWMIDLVFIFIKILRQKKFLGQNSNILTINAHVPCPSCSMPVSAGYSSPFLGGISVKKETWHSQPPLLPRFKPTTSRKAGGLSTTSPQPLIEYKGRSFILKEFKRQITETCQATSLLSERAKYIRSH